MEHPVDAKLLGGEPKKAIIRQIMLKNGMFFDEQQIDQLEAFVRLLTEWNQKINLVSRKDIEHIWEAHILHSMSILFQGEIPVGACVLDLGSGGGLPGIPLKILRPDLSIHILDATRKKMDAVASMIESLKLLNTEVFWGRAEDPAAIAALGGTFDVVLARAVAPLVDLIEWSHPFLKRNSEGQELGPRLIALKGGDLKDEISRASQAMNVKEVTLKELTFYGSELIPGPEKRIVSVRFHT